jgi:hypothetical protein
MNILFQFFQFFKIIQIKIKKKKKKINYQKYFVKYKNYD